MELEGLRREVAGNELAISIEMYRAACVVAAILMDRKSSGVLPNDSDVINGIRLVLSLANQSHDLPELIRSRDQLLAPWLVDYLDAIRPRWWLLPNDTEAQKILELGKSIEPRFAKAIEAIRQDPKRFVAAPHTVDEWIERSAYAYLQMQARIREKQALERSEFNVESIDDE